MKISLPGFICIVFLNGISAQDRIPGFNEKRSGDQHELELRFDRELNPGNYETWIKKLSSRPHHVGSPFGEEVTRYIAEQFSAWGYQVKIDTYFVLFPTPRLRALEMTFPVKYKAVLSEPGLREDATSGQIREQLPSYNAYSADGDVEGELVYVNYGVKEDYEQLERMGISVKDKIVIARYMGSWRGIKPKLAAEHGAKGCIIYSDPRDDGYFQGDVYPNGSFRNAMGVQRGSVIDLPVSPGDPLTPGYAANRSAERIEVAEAATLMKIPVLPISYHDAEPMLKTLKGQVCPESWRGALPFTYHTGPGPARVRLNLEFNWDIKPAYNVVATLIGTRYPDQWIIRGNHHDAWVNGAADPVSGIASLMEEARIIGNLARQGYSPERTIMYCAWDAEEPGLIGSTEWVEGHKDELKEKAVLYINTDGLERGFLFAAGSHSLTSFMESVAASVTDPQINVSVLERWKASQIVRVGLEKFKGFQLGALGSGSDFTPFIQHLGISSLNIAFGGEGDGGEYHSIYDSYDHFTRFKDPGFFYCGALTRITGHAVLRFANSDVLPFDFTEMDSTLENYTRDLMDFAGNKRRENDEVNYRIRNNLYKIAADPKKEYHSPKLKQEVPFLNFTPMQNALSLLGKNVLRWEKINTDSLTSDKLTAYNRLVFLAERKFIQEEGLPGRAWYKHALYAPGLLTGYDVKIMPGIREALENEDWDLAQKQINIIAGKIIEYSEFLDQVIRSVGE